MVDEGLTQLDDTYIAPNVFFFGIYFIHVNYELYLISTNILLLETLLFGSWKLECNLLQSLITVKLVAMFFDHLS